MWRKQRMEIYVTLLPGSTLAEWYVVVGTDSGGSDLVAEGLCDASKVPLELLASWSRLLGARTAAPSM